MHLRSNSNILDTNSSASQPIRASSGINIQSERLQITESSRKKFRGPAKNYRKKRSIFEVIIGLSAIVGFLGFLVCAEWNDLSEDWRHIFNCLELQMAFTLIAIYGYVYWRQATRGPRIVAQFEKTKGKIDKSKNNILNRIYTSQQKRHAKDMAKHVTYELDKYSYEITPRLYDKYDDWISRLAADCQFHTLYEMWEMFQKTNVRQVADDMINFSQNGGIR
jgi:hypothetical protein